MAGILACLVLAGCSADSSGQCANPPLEFEGRQYDLAIALEGTPMEEEVGTANLKGCAMREGDPVSPDTEVTLYRIRGIDPAVALGTVSTNGAPDSIGIAFEEDEPLEYGELPKELSQYVEKYGPST